MRTSLNIRIHFYNSFRITYTLPSSPWTALSCPWAPLMPAWLSTAGAWSSLALGLGRAAASSTDKYYNSRQSDLVAKGTSDGTVLLYSTIEGELVTTCKTENSSKTKSATFIYAAGERMGMSSCSLTPSSAWYPPSSTALTPCTPCPIPEKWGNHAGHWLREIHIWVMAMASKKVTKTLDRSC